MTTAPFNYPTTLNHRGKAMYFVSRPRKANQGDAIYYNVYNVLNPKLESADKAEDWDGYTELKFPSEISVAGVDILRLERGVLNQGFFRALTDQQYIYIFRASSDALYVNRYVLVEQPNANIEGETKLELQPAWEVRFQRSGKPDTPAGAKDTQSFFNLDGKEFIEPVIELPLGWGNRRLDFSKGWFDVSLLPTNTAGVLRWLFLVADQKTGSLLSYTLDRSKNGWFQFADNQFDESNKLIRPDIAMGFLQDGQLLHVAGPPAVVVYNKQEPVEAADSTVLRLRQAYRLMACCKVNTAANSSRLGVLDIAIDNEGKLVYPPWPNQTVPAPFTLGAIQPASYGLHFDGQAWVSLAGEALTLGAAFTQQIWVYSSIGDVDTHTIVGGDHPGMASRERPPSIWIKDRFRIGIGFGTGTDFLSTETVDNVLNSNSWNNIIAIFKNGRYTLLVNGAPVALKEHNFAAPGTSPINGIGGRSLGSFQGELAELRIWSAAREDLALKYLYQRIPDDEIAKMPDLQAYYRLDEGKGTQIENLVAARRRPGALHGAQWKSMTTPLQARSTPNAYIDPRGLAFYGGYIQPGSDPRFPEFGGLADGSRPNLLSSADGYLHLYYQGTKHQFLVAHYDTSSDRAHYGVRWTAGSSNPEKRQQGYLVFSSRQTGVVFNRGTIKFTYSPAENENEWWKLWLKDGQNGKETWNGLPPTVSYIAAVLSGQSVDDPADRRLLTGERVFYDYSGERRLAFWPVGDPLQHGMLQFVSRNKDSYVFREIYAKPDSGGKTYAVRLAIAYEKRDDSKYFWKTLLNVPVGALDFADTINGVSTSYDYTDPANAGDGASFYEIPAGGPSFLAIADPKVEGNGIKMAMEISPGTRDPSTCCNVKIQLNVPMHIPPSIAAEWTNVSRKPEEFVAAIRDSQEDSQKQVADYLRFFLKSTAGMVEDGLVTEEASLYAATSFVDVFSLNANGKIGEFRLFPQKIQSVDENDNSRKLRVGSLLFAVYNGRPADNGFPEVISDSTEGQTIDAELLQPGRAGGWIAESPRAAVAINSERSVVEIPLNTAINKPLAVSGSLTLETWSKPKPPTNSQKAVNVPYSRLIHANLDSGDDGSKYMVGTNYSAALQFLWAQERGAGKIEIDDNAISNNRNWLFPSANYSVSVYVKADLSTAARAPGRIYEIVPLLQGFPTHRLTVSGAGVLSLDVIQNGNTTPHPLNQKLNTETWSMVTISRQGTTVQTYVDGSPDIAFSISDYPGTPMHHRLLVGDNGQSSPFQMQLNQFAVWQRPLGPADVKSRFNLALPVDDESLILLWRMDTFSADDRIANDALQSGADYNAQVKGFYSWQFPGVFLQAFAAVRNHAVSTRGALLASGVWNQVCAVYESHWGVRFSEQAFGDCGAEDNLNMETALSLEAWINQKRQVVGANQVLFSKFDVKPGAQCYEFGINGNNRPYLQLRLKGRKGLILRNDKIEEEDVAEKDLYFTVAGTRDLRSARDYYVCATASITSEVKEVSFKTKKKTMNVYTLHVQIYVDGEPSGAPFVSPDMYGAVTMNQSSVSANIGRTKPTAPPSEQSYYDGELSDLRLWNRALSGDDVKSNFQSVAQEIKGEGLVSAWYFREQEGRVAFDSESENNATLSNRDLWIPYHGSAVLRLVLNGREAPLLKREPSDFAGYEQKQICFGGMRNANGAYRNTFIGKLDEFRVWAEVRTLDQIRDNKERFQAGNEKNLVGYWRFNAHSGDIIIDDTGQGNNGRFAAFDANDLPVWQGSEAPISNEAGIVLNTLGGIETRFLTSISAGPAVVEYAETQLDFRKEAFSIYKRCYVYLDLNGIVQEDTSFKVGDLSRVYLGQVQSKPSLIGYIEGAPPLPSENLTRPYYDSPMAYTNYNNIASVTLSEADNTSVAFSSTRQTGSQLAFGIKGGFALGSKVAAGAVFVMGRLADASFSIGAAADINWSISASTDIGITYGLTTTSINSLANSGDWDALDSAYYLKTGQRRYLPANTGYALVKSMTADMYALYLKTTGAMVGFSIVPNLDIPADNNIIYFPIDPGYTKNGCLDGRVGLQADPDLRGDQKSYFQPVEAYSLKRRIEKEEQEMLAYYEQFNAVERGQAQEDDLSETIEDNPVFDFAGDKPRLNMVNQYVWTAPGGFFAEKESATAVRQESHSGVYSFKWNLGFSTAGKFLFGGPGITTGFYFDASLLGGTQWTITVKKTKTESKSFALDISANLDGLLRRYQKDGKSLYSEKNVPGKVDTYRFFSFYLSPEEEHFDHFFSRVVDKQWLKLSDDPRAAALREAQSNPNPPWRIMHRVTFVSRIPPEFQVFPLDTQAPDTSVPPNLVANELLLRMVGARIGASDPSPAIIGQAVRDVLAKDLVKTIPWWQAFLDSAGVDNSPASLLLGDLTRDMIGYLLNYYETKPSDLDQTV